MTLVNYNVAYPVKDLATGRATFNHEKTYREGEYYYSRYAQPTVEKMVTSVSRLQGASYGVATSSGMAAIDAVIHTFLGDCPYTKKPLLIYGEGVYYETDILFQRRFKQLGFNAIKLPTYYPTKFAQKLENLDMKKLRLVYLETPENPLLGVSNIRAIRDILNQLAPQALLVVDNSALPCFQQSLQEGSDLEIMSLTKYLSQGSLMGGVILTNSSELENKLRSDLYLSGAVMAARDSVEVMQRLETLCSRMQKHCFTAAEIAQKLQEHPAIERVYYPVLQTIPGTEDLNLINRQMQGVGGGIVSFQLKGGLEKGNRLMELLLEQKSSCLSITPSFGMASTHLEHYYSFLRERTVIKREQTSEKQIIPGFCRLAVGLDSCEIIWNDLNLILTKLI